MSTVTVEPGQARPRLGLPLEGRLRRRPTPDQALAWSTLPLVISGLVNLAYFVSYWVPEVRSVPGMDLLLRQVAPLASAELTDQGHSVETAGTGRSGLGAAYLLIASAALPALARAQFWLARLSLPAMVLLAVLTAIVIALDSLGRGLVLDTVFGLLLLAAWVVAAVVTAWRSVGVDPTALPLRPIAPIWLLGAYALLTPVPVAVGRFLFGRDLREVALELADGSFNLRWAALVAPTTLPLYAAGLLVGVLAAVTYLVVPPRRPGVPMVPLLVSGLVALVLLGVVGVVAASAAHRRAEQIRMTSPVEDVGYHCASWTQPAPGEPTRSLIVSGTGCQRLRAYQGYREVGAARLPASVSPLRVAGPGGRTVSADHQSARFDDLVVLAGTTRFDNRPTQVLAVRITDAALLWKFTCPRGEPLTLRLVGSSDATRDGDGKRAAAPAAVVDCEGRQVRLDPATGRIAR